MPIIYKPKGKALEYSKLAANLYKGCSHGCKYCYVPGIPPYKFKKNAREEFYSNPLPRADVIRQLQRDAKKLEGDKRPVLCKTILCARIIVRKGPRDPKYDLSGL